MPTSSINRNSGLCRIYTLADGKGRGKGKEEKGREKERERERGHRNDSVSTGFRFNIY